MRHLVSLLLWIWGLAPSAFAAPNPFSEVKEFTLNNGLQLYYAQLPEAKFFKLSFYVWAGSVDEKEGLDEGAAHFVEHLLFQGKDFSESDMDRAIDAMGGSHNAFTHRQFTQFYVYLPKVHLNDGSAKLWRVAFNDAPDVSKREQVLKVIDQENQRADLNKINFRRNSSKLMAMPGFWQRNFYLKEYDRPAGGRPEQAKRLGMAQAEAFHHRYYVTPNMTGIYVGPHPHQTVLKVLNALARKQPGRIQGEPNRRKDCPKYQTPLPAYRRLEFQEEDPDITMGFLLSDIQFSDAAALALYAESMNRTLYELIRGESAETYTVQRFVESYRQCGYIAFRSQASRPHYPETFKLMQESLAGGFQTTITAQEFARSQQNFLRYLQERSDNPEFLETYLSLLIREHLDHHPSPAELNWLKAITEVDYDDLKSWSSKKLQNAQSYIFLRSPALVVPYDTWIFFLLITIATVFFWRRFFIKPEHLRQEKYLTYFNLNPFEYLMLIGLFWLSLIPSALLAWLVQLLFEWFLIDRIPLYLGGYFKILVSAFIVVSYYMTIVASCIPQKLVITRDFVAFIKLNGRSIAMPVSQIQEVIVAPAREIRRRFPFWPRRGHRFVWWMNLFRGRGIVLVPNSGPPMAFKVRDLDNCAAKLAELMGQKESDRQITLFSLPLGPVTK